MASPNGQHGSVFYFSIPYKVLPSYYQALQPDSVGISFDEVGSIGENKKDQLDGSSLGTGIESSIRDGKSATARPSLNLAWVNSSRLNTQGQDICRQHKFVDLLGVC